MSGTKPSLRPTTWLHDRRPQLAFCVKEGKRRYDLKATPDTPGGSFHLLTCKQLPEWVGRVHSGKPTADYVAFQFMMQSREARKAINEAGPGMAPQVER